MVGAGPVVLTAEGKEELELELEQLRTDKRPSIERRIHELSHDGDVSDNSEYEDTKEQLVHIDARIREIEHMLRRVQVIKPAAADGVVHLGSHVTLVDQDGESETWTVVSKEEANSTHGKISTSSPVGSALLGKRVGDTLVVRAPGGETTFTVEKVN